MKGIFAIKTLKVATLLQCKIPSDEAILMFDSYRLRARIVYKQIHELRT